MEEDLPDGIGTMRPRGGVCCSGSTGGGRDGSFDIALIISEIPKESREHQASREAKEGAVGGRGHVPL
jgi:hypothetical protein